MQSFAIWGPIILSILASPLFGFYKGYKASMIRLIMGQSCNFGTYETLKSIFKVNSRKNKK